MIKIGNTHFTKIESIGIRSQLVPGFIGYHSGRIDPPEFVYSVYVNDIFIKKFKIEEEAKEFIAPFVGESNEQ